MNGLSSSDAKVKLKYIQIYSTQIFKLKKYWLTYELWQQLDKGVTCLSGWRTANAINAECLKDELPWSYNSPGESVTCKAALLYKRAWIGSSGQQIKTQQGWHFYEASLVVMPEKYPV